MWECTYDPFDNQNRLLCNRTLIIDVWFDPQWKGWIVVQDLSFSAWVSTVLGVDAGGEMLLKVLYQGDHKDSKKMHWSRRVRLAHAQLSYAHAQAVLKGNQNNCDPGGGGSRETSREIFDTSKKIAGFPPHLENLEK